MQKCIVAKLLATLYPDVLDHIQVIYMPHSLKAEGFLQIMRKRSQAQGTFCVQVRSLQTSPLDK